MREHARRSLGILLAAVLLAVLICAKSEAQEKNGPLAQKKDAADPLLQQIEGNYSIWKLHYGFNLQAGATMFGTLTSTSAMGTLPSPIVARMLLSSEEEIFLRDTEWRFDLDKVVPLDLRALDRIQDGRPLPSVYQKEWKELTKSELGWYYAFNEALILSRLRTMDQFKRSAEENEHVKYSHLKTMPPRYRGKVITVKGKLAVIKKEDAPRLVFGQLKHIYTGWIIVDPPGRVPPFAIAFTDLPDGAKVSDKLNLEATFYGYFLSMVRFPADKKAGKAADDVVCPYFVGKIASVRPLGLVTNDDDKTSYSYYLIVSTVGGIVAIAFVVVALNLWLRRGDRRIQSRLLDVRDKHLPFNVEPAEPEPAPTTAADERKDAGPPPAP